MNGLDPNPLDDLLRTSISALDITPQERALAVSRYNAVARALSDYWNEDPADGVVYPQGSMRLGTVTRNYHRNDEIDLDLVARRDQPKDSITKADLKEDTGRGLEEFLSGDPEGSPRLEEGKRCWTLLYGGFHVDILPALPNQDSRSRSGIIITDRELHQWLPSDPIGFADWFHEVMRKEWENKLVILSKRMGVDRVPDWAVKTTLQQAVQALKRHRDIYFTHNLKDRPASIIISTLAARAYRGGGSLYEVLDDITDRLPRYVEQKSGRWVVANPVQGQENFADRWNHSPERAEHFFRWAGQARADFTGLGEQRGLNNVISKIAAAFGDRAADAAARASSSEIVDARRRSTLGITAGTGVLTPAIGGRGVRPVRRDHDFHGDATPRP